ncbi:MAG: DUF4349 domain-containing protein [Proteobacteria bacterium]|nr:DUF4349 domain-containing protein [Pseudomonadota bacterium]
MKPTMFACLALAAVACSAGSDSYAPAPMPPVAQAGFSLESTSDSLGERKRGLIESGAEVNDRKLIRTGSVSVIVEEYAPFHAEISQWLNTHGGYVADTNQHLDAGRVGWSTLTVRVPNDQLDTLVSWCESKVEVQSLSLNSQDVTEQWTDLAARLTNAQRTETRLAKLLEHETDTLTDVLAVEREIARVRGEIESMEGRLRVLNNQITLSSFTINVAVRDTYSPEIMPTFTTQAGNTFSTSVKAMGELGRFGALAAVGLAPWLLALLGMVGVFGSAAYSFIRWWR